MKSDNFESELPEGYELALHIDASNKKLAVCYLLLSLVPMLITVAIAVLIAVYVRGWDEGRDPFDYSIETFVACAVMVVYIVLHELTHGVTYKILTGGKLTFGLRWNVAFCGVPDIYVYRKSAKIAVLMPFLVFNVVFVAITVGMYFVSAVAFIASAFVLGIHVGGCVGDLHVTYLFDHKFRDNKTLMRDTGPEQFFYIYKGETN